MSRRTKAIELFRSAPQVLPSLLQCDFGNLEREVNQLNDAGIRALHLDVMDGLFVPNLTYGMPIVEGLRRLTDATLDVHLMIDRPERYIEQFFDAGADVLTVHIEAFESPDQAGDTLAQIRDMGAASGIALNPDTPLEAITPVLDHCDLALVMSVNAGFGGQTFNPIALEKLERLSKSHPNLALEVDGGVNTSTIANCAKAGAGLLVVGSAIFNHDDYQPAVGQLHALLG